MTARQDYPALLAVLAPDQAVHVLNDRVALIKQVNSSVADWLQERRKVEDAYVQGLRKLASRPQHDGGASLGVFQIAWQRIVSGTENLAAAHEVLAQKIETDVEGPLRRFNTSNREIQAVTSSQGNLASIARGVESAQKKAAKGGRKAEDATSSVGEASHSWESQAPYIFEQLQALDEQRINHLRDVLTQLQTHELDQVERSRTSAESCLNALLNVETADEIKAFAGKAAAGRRNTVPARRSSAAGSTRPASSSASTHIPPAAPPPRLSQQNPTQSSAASYDQPAFDQTPHKSKLGGLKRLGTVIKGRKGSGLPQPPFTEKREKKGRPFSAFRRGDSSNSFQELETTGQDLPRSSTDGPRNALTQVQSTVTETQEEITPPLGSPETEDATARDPTVNGTIHPLQPVPVSVPDPISHRGQTTQSQPDELAALQPIPVQRQHLPPQEAVAAVSPTLQEEGSPTADSEEGARNFAIRDMPIHEDEGAAHLAINSMAHQLRIQAQSSGLNRSQGTVAVRPLHDDLGVGSDTTSIHSAYSLAGQPQHPELHEPGLNASIFETVNSWFNESGITKSFVTGEIALAYNATSADAETEVIRLQHFELLEKIAANPIFIKAPPKTESVTEDSAGTYSVSLSSIHRSTPLVGLKYQLHIDAASLSQYSPLLITPAWQLIEGQASIIVQYGLNPMLAASTATPITLKNVVISVSLDPSGPSPQSAMMSPQQGALFRRKTATVIWRLPEFTIKPEQSRLLVRFITPGGTAKKGSIEVKFELPGRASSQIAVLQRKVVKAVEKDPFADDETERISEEAAETWEEVSTKRCLVSGRYTAA
ncbi:hypothetical protein DV736_g4860, partial [Chaetothyriales sp. CBS 134916]